MRVQAIGILAVIVATAACGGGSGGTTTTTAVTATTIASTTVTTFGGTPGAAQDIACAQDARTLQQASDFYATAHGAPAPSIDALVADGMISDPPSIDHGYVISYDASTGNVTAAGACTYP